MTWRSPAAATAHTVRGSDRLRAWCAGFSLHAGVVVPDYDREALERLCRLCGARHKRHKTKPLRGGSERAGALLTVFARLVEHRPR